MEGEEFEKYGLKEDILKALCSKNGTGKTGAYVIPCLNQVDTSVNAIQGRTQSSK